MGNLPTENEYRYLRTFFPVCLSVCLSLFSYTFCLLPVPTQVNKWIH